jgi:hypothetical protein
MMIAGNWKTDNETNLRFFSSRRAKNAIFARAALFPLHEGMNNV